MTINMPRFVFFLALVNALILLMTINILKTIYILSSSIKDHFNNVLIINNQLKAFLSSW